MIPQKEIRTIALNNNVPSNTIDKDYVLGHLLNGLFSFEWAKENFVFKGGTCLRKCYFIDYRFSEDIDITVINKSFVFTLKMLNEALNKTTSESGILFNILSFTECHYNNEHVGWDVELCFWGANHSRNDTPNFGNECHTKISFDIRLYEYIHFSEKLISKKILHNYSDSHMIISEIVCYSVEEILSEKLRALLQRKWGESRDYYDIWYLKNNVDNIDWSLVVEAFDVKCQFKNVVYNDVEDFFMPNRILHVIANWENRLSHQLSEPIDREKVLIELQAFFKTIF